MVILLWMKTAVSIPDDVFDRAEQLARERNVSRSQLYADALRLLVATDERVTEQLDAVHGDAVPSEVDRAVDTVARRVLADADW